MPDVAEQTEAADMLMVLKLQKGENELDPQAQIWFERAAGSRRATWITADPLNFKPRWDRLKLRRNFFTERVISEWKRILVDVKQKPTAASFKAAYAKH